MKTIKTLTFVIIFSLLSCASELKFESSSSDEALLSIVEGVLLELERHDEVISCSTGETLIERRVPTLEHKAMLAVEKLEILSRAYLSTEIADSVRARLELKMSELVEKAISHGITHQSGITEFLNVDYLEFLIDGGSNQAVSDPRHVLSDLRDPIDYTSPDELVFNSPLVFQNLFYPTNYFNKKSRAHESLIDLALRNKKIEELYNSKSQNIRDYPLASIQAEFNTYLDRLFIIYTELLRYGCFSRQNFYNPRLELLDGSRISLSLNGDDSSMDLNTRGSIVNTNCPIAFEGGGGDFLLALNGGFTPGNQIIHQAEIIPKSFFYDGFFKTVKYCVPEELLKVLPLDHSYYWDSRSRIRDVDMAREQAPRGGDML